MLPWVFLRWTSHELDFSYLDSEYERLEGLKDQTLCFSLCGKVVLDSIVSVKM